MQTHYFRPTLLICLSFFILSYISAQEYTIKGLDQEVEIIVDVWGISHIYAETEKDLFYAQGWNAARDRLFQFEIWRRQATGSSAEILGPRALKRDIGTRLFKFRGDIKEEMNHYHKNGELIISAFTNGVNAYIEYALANKDELPIEFELLGILPQKWTPEIVISRHQGLLGNIGQELSTARQIAVLGEETTRKVNYFHPKKPDLKFDDSLDPECFKDDILELYNAYRRPLRFLPEDLIAGLDSDLKHSNIASANSQFNELQESEDFSIGSNNWVISGTHTSSGYPMMANDPHRTQSTPSLRYMSHLVAPGWNVIGGGEPEIPGISIGHNEYGAWGLTVFRTDAEDLYVYKLNPENEQQYWHKGKWLDFKVITETIKVKGQSDHIATLEYTVHGPVSFKNKDEGLAFAVRCGWMEVGGSPYLASLRMDQSKNFDEFKAACNYSNIPGENMIWADKQGNIGWQAVGIAPIRKNWSGLLPVPGDGSHEWDGYLPIIEKPNVYNPENGIFSTANQNVTPLDYKIWEAIGYSWSDPYRGERVEEVLRSGRKFTVHDLAKLQTDYSSLPARILIPMLTHLQSEDKSTQQALERLQKWQGHQLTPESIEAAIYVEWENTLKQEMENLLVPKEARSLVNMQLYKVISFLAFPDGMFGKDPLAGRDVFLLKTLQTAVLNLEKRLGSDQSKWQYGQLKNKHIKLNHVLGDLVTPDLQKKLNVGPHPRGGNGYTVGSTGGNYNQSSGASFKVIIDTGNWDESLFMNSPGQSGNPDSPFYKNLFDAWAKDKYLPLFYTRPKIESTAAHKINLKPTD